MQHPLGNRVLVLAAHPDDEALGCGGTIAQLSRAGVPVHVAFLADGVGARAADGGTIVSDEFRARRSAASKALALLGTESVDYFDFPDNRLDTVSMLSLAQAVESLLARYKPDMVITHHAGDLNIDHRRAHEAVLTACRPQPGASVERILCFEVPSSTEWQAPGVRAAFTPQLFVDISRELSIKQSALRAYAAEMRPWPHSRSYQALDHLARWRGASCGAEAAEAFVVARWIMRGCSQ